MATTGPSWMLLDERKESISLRQSMHMLVGDTVNRKISHERGTLAKCLNCKGNSRGFANPLASP
jgi:hypothetical protein